jgi:hypothetical protein
MMIKGNLLKTSHPTPFGYPFAFSQLFQKGRDGDLIFWPGEGMPDDGTTDE